MTTCVYEFTVRSRQIDKAEYVTKCSLTGYACFCPEDYLQCVRRAYALAYEARKQEAKFSPPI
jgi:hypothetical protein